MPYPRPIDWGNPDDTYAIEAWEDRQRQNHPELYPEPAPKVAATVPEKPVQRQQEPESTEPPEFCFDCGKRWKKCICGLL